MRKEHPSGIYRKNPFSGLKYAQEGVLHTFRTQQNMRIHFYAMVAVLLAGLLLNLDNRDMLVLLFAATLVMVAEMFNTVIEVVVDMITDRYDAAAKLAKDVAAGAVLISAMNALIAGTLIFFGQKKLTEIQDRMRQNIPPDITKVVVIGVVLMALIVIISKLLSDTGTVFRGGIVSGHSAIGFLLAMTIFFNVENTAIAVLAILLALIVAQSRVDAGIHSLREVVLGAALAILVTALVYRVAPSIRAHFRAKPPQKTALTVSKASFYDNRRIAEKRKSRA